MKSKSIVVVMLVSLLAIIPMIPNAFAAVQQGPRSDILRGKVITSPDAALLAMMTDEADVSPDQIRTTDIETQISAGFLVTSNRGFHMGYIAYNIRADQSYRRTDLALGFWPLADVAFRHALIHGYDQLGIIPPIYGYIVTPVRSLVPPAQAYWYNPNTPEHPFTLGDPVTSPAGEHSTVGILKAAGYSYDDRGTGDTADDRWLDPNGNPLPKMLIWTPLESIAPTSWQHGQEFVKDLGTIGLRATSANGFSGMDAEGADFNWYLAKVFDESDFDGYMVFWGLGRAPDQMYLLTHSDFDTLVVPGSYNAPGINDPDLDALLETMMFTLPPSPGDPDPRRDAAFEAQSRLYDPNYDYALAYMLLYSRNYFNAFDQDLRGIIKSPGYGSDNGWTWLNAYFDPATLADHTESGKTVINYINGEKPESFNPTYASTVYEWFYIGGTMDGLMAVNPFNHLDKEWMATNWTLVETGNPAAPMEITYTLRDDVEWQDGRLFTASDAAFSLNFLKDWAIPRYSSTWQFIVSISVPDATHITVSASETNWVLLYDFAGVSALLAPQVWDRDWTQGGTLTFAQAQQEVLNYDPTEPYNVAPGYTAGPHPPPTNLFGTGPWIFQFYDASNLYGDLWANRNYFESTGSGTVTTRLTEMFHEIGDVNEDGHIWGTDYYRISVSFGYFWWEVPPYDVDADLDQNGFVEIQDMATAAFHIDWFLDESARPPPI